jgi:hypothetical protein
MQWFMTEPPILEWLQIFYRIKMAENGIFNNFFIVEK